MAKTILAVYEGGVFKPLEQVHLEEGQQVEICVSQRPDEAEPTKEAETDEELLRRLGYQAFQEVTEEEWAQIAESWRRA